MASHARLRLAPLAMRRFLDIGAFTIAPAWFVSHDCVFMGFIKGRCARRDCLDTLLRALTRIRIITAARLRLNEAVSFFLIAASDLILKWDQGSPTASVAARQRFKCLRSGDLQKPSRSMIPSPFTAGRPVHSPPSKRRCPVPLSSPTIRCLLHPGLPLQYARLNASASACLSAAANSISSGHMDLARQGKLLLANPYGKSDVLLVAT